MADPFEVPTAGFAIAQTPTSLATLGIGSCMAVCLYSQEHKGGALIHYMLPRAGQHFDNPYLYADTALSDVLERLLHSGVERTDLTAKLVGGAQMFPTVQSDAQSLGRRNIEEAERLLKILGIPVVGRDVGGNRGRSLLFDLGNGNVSVTKVFDAAAVNI